MICKNVTQLLDERDLAELSAKEAAELEAHVSHCAECAAQCLASERMASFRTDVPRMPTSLSERVSRLHAACETTTGLYRTRRPLILGSLLLLGAGATVSLVVPWRGASAANR